MNDYDRKRMLQSARELRGIADDLRTYAPAESVKADALASSVEIRIKRLDAVR